MKYWDTYIATLPADVQAKIGLCVEFKLQAILFGYAVPIEYLEPDYTNAMNSRLCDLDGLLSGDDFAEIYELLD